MSERTLVVQGLAPGLQLYTSPTQELKETAMTNNQMETCVGACNACADACDACSTACLSEPDIKMMADCIRLDLDCAAICRLASGFMARGSARARDVCRVCAMICDACAAECAKHKVDHCQRCAEACRVCAAECRKMAG
jgi:hypothetical protein